MNSVADTLTPNAKAIASRGQVRTWLYFIAFLVALMVIVGGATRLTDSGLSITEWKPVVGAIPPLSVAEWNEEFEKYKQIPEYQKINKGMSLAEFKTIFWWEWSHRFLGRFVGIAFFLPMVFFWTTGRLQSHMMPKLVLLFVLGGLQGAIGWWMVASGLVNRVDVSQYRLAIHLTLASIIFAYAIWLARGLAPHSAGAAPAKLRKQAGEISVLVLFQIYLGGLVAGLDAGLAYNTWPLMDGTIWPGGLHVIEPIWRNYFENPKLVQFLHRMNAYLIFAYVGWHMLHVLTARIDTPHRNRAVLLFLLVTLQAALGIGTLVLQVPIDWALTHQFGAIVVLGFAIAHWRGMRGGME